MSAELQTIEIVVIEPATVLAAYAEGRYLSEVIQQVRDVVETFEHDMSTKTGRDRTRSLANKVPKVKTRLDQMGKDLTSDLKQRASKCDSSRKHMRDELDALKVIARQPLTDWEEAEAKAEAERQAIAAAEILALEVESDHEMALLMNEKLDREAADAKAESERVAKIDAEYETRIRKERETRIAAEAAERATRDANEQAERKEAARIAEEDRIQAEQAKREANKAHCRKINSAVLDDLLKAGIDKETGKNLVKLIIAGAISHTRIIY